MLPSPTISAVPEQAAWKEAGNLLGRMHSGILLTEQESALSGDVLEDISHARAARVPEQMRNTT